jgi:hypothetical protein
MDVARAEAALAGVPTFRLGLQFRPGVLIHEHKIHRRQPSRCGRLQLDKRSGAMIDAILEALEKIEPSLHCLVGYHKTMSRVKRGIR